MRIGIDLDDVTFDSITQLNIFYNRRYNTSFKIEDYKIYHVEHIWGGLPGKAKEILDEFSRSQEFNSIVPMELAVEAISNLKKVGDFVAFITARYESEKEKTPSQIKKYFGDIQIPVFYTEQLSLTKLEICKLNNINLMLEDRIDYSEVIAKGGIQVLLFDKPWNQGKLPNRITRVKNWLEASNYIEQIREKLAITQ